MHEFLSLVLKIAFSHLYNDPLNPQASQLYESLFPKKQENVVFQNEPGSEAAMELKMRVVTYVHEHVLA